MFLQILMKRRLLQILFVVVGLCVVLLYLWQVDVLQLLWEEGVFLVGGKRGTVGGGWVVWGVGRVLLGFRVGFGGWWLWGVRSLSLGWRIAALRVVRTVFIRVLVVFSYIFSCCRYEFGWFFSFLLINGLNQLIILLIQVHSRSITFQPLQQEFLVFLLDLIPSLISLINEQSLQTFIHYLKPIVLIDVLQNLLNLLTNNQLTQRHKQQLRHVMQRNLSKLIRSHASHGLQQRHNLQQTNEILWDMLDCGVIGLVVIDKVLQ